MDIGRIYGWEAETRDGRVYSSDFLNANNRGGYPSLPHSDIGIFRITMLVFQAPQATLDHLASSGLSLGEGKKFNILTIHLEEGERVIYRTRVEMRTGEGARRCILAGARKNVKGRDVQRLHWIFEDTGEIHCTDRFREDHAWFYSPNVREYEVAP